MIPQISAQISALDANLFKNFVVSILQLISLIHALEVLVVRTFPRCATPTFDIQPIVTKDSLATLPSNPPHKADPDDDVIWRANPRAKVELGDVVKRVLPLHHVELMRSPVEDFVGHWQATVVPSSQCTDERILDGYETDSW